MKRMKTVQKVNFVRFASRAINFIVSDLAKYDLAKLPILHESERMAENRENLIKHIDLPKSRI